MLYLPSEQNEIKDKDENADHFEVLDALDRELVINPNELGMSSIRVALMLAGFAICAFLPNIYSSLSHVDTSDSTQAQAAIVTIGAILVGAFLIAVGATSKDINENDSE